QDGICSAEDICPTIYNPDQAVGCLDLAKASIRPKLGSGRVKAQGTLGPLPVGRQLTDIVGVEAFVDNIVYVPAAASRCTLSHGKLGCRGHLVSLLIAPGRHGGPLTFKVRFAYASLDVYGPGTHAFEIALLDVGEFAVSRGTPGFECTAVGGSLAAHCPP